MIHSLHIQGYRSLSDFSLKLAPLTVIQGLNGVGKSNLYKALRLFGSLADGNFPTAMTLEGGTASCLWAGPIIGPKKRKEVILHLKATDFHWNIVFGLIPSGPSDPSLFKGDPDIKKEIISPTSGEPSHHRSEWSGKVPHNESLISYVRDSRNHPLLGTVREEITSWRFYDSFRHDTLSPLRISSPRTWSPVLSETGDNLAAAIQTIFESGGKEAFCDLIATAFPGHDLEISADGGSLDLLWSQPDLSRPTKAHELSDGTLQFLALATALFSPRPPSLLVLNEPENSLSPSLIPILTELIAHANRSSQILVITHSSELATSLSTHLDASSHTLAQQEGATRLIEDLGPRRIWKFDS